MKCGIGLCGHCQYGPVFTCKDGPVFSYDRIAALLGRAESEMAKRKPKLAVWKFSSCDGCQLSLLDCEDELLAVAEAVEIANFPEASRAVVKGPYDLSLVEGSITTPHDAERIHGIRRASKFLVTIGACATAGGIQALRNFKDVKEFISIVYARPDYIETLKKSTPITDHVFVDFELRGCPINKLPAGRSAQRLSEWPQAQHAAALASVWSASCGPRYA